tara:strand:+ start:4389 stop:4706 length:318 start_codon:yes stop_codon:yes gene_type:complete
MSKKQDLAKLLLSLEETMRSANLWQESGIKQSLLNSQQPFCHDTLKPEQWLQFVFIAKLEHLIKVGFPLPANCDITPYFDEALKEHAQVKEITKLTKQIDNLLSN